jgi:hypothetical protein
MDRDVRRVSGPRAYGMRMRMLKAMRPPCEPHCLGHRQLTRGCRTIDANGPACPARRAHRRAAEAGRVVPRARRAPGGPRRPDRARPAARRREGLRRVRVRARGGAADAGAAQGGADLNDIGAWPGLSLGQRGLGPGAGCAWRSAPFSFAAGRLPSRARWSLESGIPSISLLPGTAR